MGDYFFLTKTFGIVRVLSHHMAFIHHGTYNSHICLLKWLKWMVTKIPHSVNHISLKFQLVAFDYIKNETIAFNFFLMRVYYTSLLSSREVFILKKICNKNKCSFNGLYKAMRNELSMAVIIIMLTVIKHLVCALYMWHSLCNVYNLFFMTSPNPYNYSHLTH